ncbi:TPA_asm: hypothetical protein G1Q02_25450 [Salmonella enterica subsp. enterica serovar Typhimurium]|nr:hypothetical protein [Salmonella enterica subsp. enterica serovar Typhimurium]
MQPIVKRPPVLPDRVLPLAGCQRRGRLTAGGAEVVQRVARPDGREVLRKARRANERSRRGLRHPLMFKPEPPRKQVPARFRFCVFQGAGIGQETAGYPQAGDLFSFIFYLFYLF